MSTEPIIKPDGLTEEEWAQVQKMRGQKQSLDYLAEEIAQRSNRYARQRQEDVMDELFAPMKIPTSYYWAIAIGLIVIAALGIAMFHSLTAPPQAPHFGIILTTLL